MSSMQAKLAWLEAIRKKLQKFVHMDGDLESDYCLRMASALLQSLRDLAEAAPAPAPLEEEPETAVAAR